MRGIHGPGEVGAAEVKSTGPEIRPARVFQLTKFSELLRSLCVCGFFFLKATIKNYHLPQKGHGEATAGGHLSRVWCLFPCGCPTR